MTHKKELERSISVLNTALKLKNEDLQVTNKSLESFTSAASHDLRSPLTIIGAFAKLLEGRYADVLDDKGRHYLAVISNRTKGLAQLVDDLLAFSRLSLQPVEKTTVNVHLLVQQALAEMLELHAEDKKPVVQLGELPEAQADSGLLRQVWVNLLSNALKYSSLSPNPAIEITGREDGAEVIYSVRDNGAGFDMAYYDQLFEMFHRLHTESEFEGSGVGLATVQRIISRHGGRVWAEGGVGKGATFYFALPL